MEAVTDSASVSVSVVLSIVDVDRRAKHSHSESFVLSTVKYVYIQPLQLRLNQELVTR